MPSSALQNYHCHYSFYFFFAFLLRTALSSVDTLELWGGRAAPWAWQGLSTVPVCSPPTAGTPRCCHSPWAWQELRPQLCPSCAPVLSLPGGDPVVAQGWPRGSLPHAHCRGLSVSKVSRFKSAFLPRPAPATRLRYPCEWRRKTKNKNSAKSLTNASAFKH